MDQKIKYSIQPAAKSDIKQIAHLISVSLGTMDFVFPEEEVSFERIIEYNEGAISKIINDTVVAKTEDGQIVGVCGLEENKRGDFYNINLTDYKETATLVVDEKFRNHGIGSSLLKNIMQKTFKDIVFEAWGDNGQEANAHGALIKSGFIHLKRLPNFYENRGDCSFCVHRNKCEKDLCTCDIYLWKVRKA